MFVLFAFFRGKTALEEIVANVNDPDRYQPNAADVATKVPNQELTTDKR
jgi:hypothetical protein